MRIVVDDLNLPDVLDTKYDLALFASGYEARCVHGPKQIESTEIDRTCVLGFKRVAGEQRKRNDQYYLEKWKTKPIVLDTDEDGLIYERLREICSGPARCLRFLVDYSSMSRLWYAAILNWVQYARGIDRVDIDFLYSIGRYEDKFPPIVIDKIMAIPGCEGGAPRFDETVALFGLGFYGRMALCVLEQLQPDRSYAYFAAPGAFQHYEERVRTNNTMFIEGQADEPFHLPLRSVETTLRYMTDIVLPYLPENNVVHVPMGPKPHVLAANLLSLKFPEVSCLRVSALRERPETVEPTGEIIATRVAISH